MFIQFQGKRIFIEKKMVLKEKEERYRMNGKEMEEK